MSFKPLLFKIWDILIHHGIALATLLVLAMLIPRAGRLTIRLLNKRLNTDQESAKASLALIGALVYVLQAIAYFVIIMLALTNLGVPAMGAAIPATVVSAAVGFGAQSVIGDFLSGFFIISERQFGMGDFVSFDGTSNAISGTVVGLTLRATKIRTASGEVVTIPNGKAGVITNYSQEWSKAVVDMDIPIQPGESMKDLVHIIENATESALNDPSVCHDVTGELEILPAMDVKAPSVAGQPWTVITRVIVQVNPARQWAVERAIRAALLNTFWNRYEQTPDALGNLPPRHALKTTSTPEPTSGLHRVANHGSEEEGPGHPTYPKPEEAPKTATPTPPSEELSPEEKMQDALSVGGRIRSSTTLLIAALLALGLLALFSSNPEDGDAGILSPDRYRQPSLASTEEKTPTPHEKAQTHITQPTQTTHPTTTAPTPKHTQPHETTKTDTNNVDPATPETSQEPAPTSHENDAIATEPKPTD